MHDPHHPVLREATLELLDPRPGAFFVDGTVGWGGHSSALLERGVVLWGLDRDPSALEWSRKRLGDGVRLHHATFSQLPELLEGRRPDGILLDLGVSSPQLDRPERGFSFRNNGPLDMRMDPTRGETAAELLARVDEAELADILYHYGEERQSRRIARAIKAGLPFAGTAALAECIAKQLPYERGQHPATRSFQGLRIAVNRELEELDSALATFPELLAPGGRLAIISFHSLEDRKVKERFRELSGEGAPVDYRGQPLSAPRFRLPVRKAVKGEDGDPHPRARSARLRVLQRLE